MSGSTSGSDSDSNSGIVLVTGGAGFIGYHTCKALLDRGDDVVIVDEMNDYYNVEYKQQNVQDLLHAFGDHRVFMEMGDICDKQWMMDVFEKYAISSIVHLAARAGVRPSIKDPNSYVETNITGTTNVFELAKYYQCDKVVYASSSSVYGGSELPSFSEKDSVDFPVSPYAATKKACELMAHTYYHLYGMSCIGLRFFTVYGPRGRPDMAPYKFMDCIYHGKRIQQYGDGTSSRDYTYIDDIVAGVLAALDRGKGYQIFNLGNGKPTILVEFIQTLEKLLSKKAKIEQIPHQPGDVPRTCANITKAVELLDYRPGICLENGLEKMVHWYLKHRI